MDVSEFALAVEDFLGPFAGNGQAAGKGAEEFDDLRNVVVVFAVFGARLRVEEVVAGDEFEDLKKKKLSEVPLSSSDKEPDVRVGE